MIVTEPGFYELSNAEYHADPCPAGSLSQSGAKTLLPPHCPARFQYQRTHPVFKATFDFGSAAHKLVLSDTDTELVVIDAEDWRTKAARDAQTRARLAGKVPILTHEYAQVEEMAAAIRAHPIASRLLAPGSGKAEQSAFWQDERTGVWRRARFDWLPHATGGRMIVPDYKTARSAHPDTFARDAAAFKYHMQADWYLSCLAALGIDADAAFVFIVQEKEPPYLVSVFELDGEALRIGRELNAEALNVYAQCSRLDVWPGYSKEVELLSLPGYYTRQYEWS